MLTTLVVPFRKLSQLPKQVIDAGTDQLLVKNLGYRLWYTSVGLVFVRTKVSDLELSIYGAHTIFVCSHPPVHAVLPSPNHLDWD